MPKFFDPRAPVETTQHNLPHWQQSETSIFLTFRLADSIPTSKQKAWQEEVAAWRNHHPTPWDDATWNEYHRRFHTPFDAWLDKGSGSCLLRDPTNRKIVTDTLHHFDQQRYLIASYVVMPNHLHILFSPHPDHQLPKIVQSWKTYIARHINNRQSQIGTRLWQPDYYDRLIRSQDHFTRTLNYIANNPKNLPRTDYTLYTA